MVHLFANKLTRKQFQQRLATWCAQALPGLVITGLVITARLTGSLQGLELFALDLLLKFRPAETPDQRIVLIAIDADDLKRIGNPIPNQTLIDLIQQLQTYKPNVIGLNLLGSLLTEPGSKTLSTALRRSKNVIVVEKILPEQIPPPAGFPPEQVGFTDINLDGDNNLRRMLLGTTNPVQPDNLEEYRFSFAIRLAEHYLVQRQIALKNGDRDPAAMQLGDTELPRVLPNSGGYANVNNNGVQMFLNFRMGQSPFQTLSLRQIQSHQFDPKVLKDAIVLIGVTDPRLRPPIPTRVTHSPTLNEGVHGLEVQAHTASQIISAVLDQRPLIKTHSDRWEYLWILLWSALGIYICQQQRPTKSKILNICITQFSLLLSTYIAINLGFWIPTLPILLILNLYIILHLILKYKLNEKQRLINERQYIINRTFDIIHNGPLQNLSNIIRLLRDNSMSTEKLLAELGALNYEIRMVGEYLKKEALSAEQILYLNSGVKLDLKDPIHQLFYEIYTSTLERDFPGFYTLKTQVRSFASIPEHYLSLEQKRGLCRFLEEALINVGKHAQGATDLSATGTLKQGYYTLRITDNGKDPYLSIKGDGTRQAERLATKLRGKFERTLLKEQGTRCELTWALNKS